jgi:outer membrane protein TolC
VTIDADRQIQTADKSAEALPPRAQSGAGSDVAQSPQAASVASPAPTYNPQADNYLGQIGVYQFIDVFGLLRSARRAQQNVRDFYVLDVTRLQNETALAAKNLFFNVLLAKAQVDTEQQQVAYAKEDVRITQDRLQQGIVSNFDVLTAQTALSTAQQQLIAAQDEYDLAQASLAYLLGTDPNQKLELTSPPLPSLDQTVDLPRSTSIAIANRPEMLQADDNIRAAQHLVKVAGSGLTPTLGVAAAVYGTSEASAGAPRNYADVSIELSAPLDDGGVTRSRVRSAKVDVQTQNVVLLQIQASVSLEVRQATINIRNAQAQVASATTGVSQAQEALRLARERYGAGLGTFLDVLNALAQVAQTRTNLSNAQFFYQSSLAQLVRAMGGR